MRAFWIVFTITVESWFTVRVVVCKWRYSERNHCHHIKTSAVREQLKFPLRCSWHTLSRISLRFKCFDCFSVFTSTAKMCHFLVKEACVILLIYSKCTCLTRVSAAYIKLQKTNAVHNLYYIKHTMQLHQIHSAVFYKTIYVLYIEKKTILSGSSTSGEGTGTMPAINNSTFTSLYLLRENEYWHLDANMELCSSIQRQWLYVAHMWRPVGLLKEWLLSSHII